MAILIISVITQHCYTVTTYKHVSVFTDVYFLNPATSVRILADPGFEGQPNFTEVVELDGTPIHIED